MSELENENTIDGSMKKLEKEIWIFFECLEKCKTTPDITKALIDIDLFQETRKDLLWIPWRSHSEQSEKVLTNEFYWKLSNARRLLEIRREIIEKWLKEFASFSVGWSIGAGYLWYLLWSFEAWRTPEVIFGASAWSLFPIFFLLWQEAIKSNPKETKVGIEWLISYLPKNLWSKTMWNNWEELIGEFKKSGQILIDNINKGRPEGIEKFQKIEDLKIWDISNTFGIIASRKKREWWFQEVIFSGGDNLLSAIIASSNPEISILGMKFSVLTNNWNRFLWNTWHDADHTNYNPLGYGEILWMIRSTQVITLPTLERHWSERFMKILQNWSYKSLSEDERIELLHETNYNTFSIPYEAWWYIFPKKQFNPLDQNSWWSIDTMTQRARNSYAKSLLYFAWCWWQENMEKNIRDARKKINEIPFSKEENDEILREVGSARYIDFFMMWCEK